MFENGMKTIEISTTPGWLLNKVAKTSNMSAHLKFMFKSSSKHSAMSRVPKVMSKPAMEITEI